MSSLILWSILGHFICQRLFRIAFALFMLAALAPHSLLHRYKFVIRDTQSVFVDWLSHYIVLYYVLRGFVICIGQPAIELFKVIVANFNLEWRFYNVFVIINLKLFLKRHAFSFFVLSLVLSIYFSLSQYFDYLFKACHLQELYIFLFNFFVSNVFY